jgi:hypothetical protein
VLNRRVAWLLAGLGLAPVAVHAEEGADPFGPQLEWKPVLDIRGRVEGAGAPLPDSHTVGQVARVGVEARRGILSARVSLQEARQWTGNGEVTSAEGSFRPDLAEGWARFDGELSPNVGGRLTIGRQAIQIDEGRLVGLRAWDLQQQFLDAFRFELQAKPLSFELVNARRFGVGEGPEASGDDPFTLGVTVLRLGAAREGVNADGRIDAVSVVDARQTSFLTSTTGFFGELTMGRGLGSAEAYVQQNNKGNATFGAFELGWVVGRNRAWVVRARYVDASGASEGSGAQGSGALSAFQPVLGDTHDQFGLLDLMQPGSDPRGLSDLAALAEVQAGARLAVRGSVHRLASSLGGLQGTYGYESDLSLTWHVTPYAVVDLGGGQIFGGTLGTRSGAYMQIDVAL